MQGDIHATGRDDILTLVLKILGHPGRVRGSGEGVIRTNFFHQARRHRFVMTNEEMTAYMNAQF